MNFIPGNFTLEGCDKINRKRLFASKYEEIDSTKKRRKIRRDKAKKRDYKMNPKKEKLIRLVPFELLHNVILCF